jgi:putative hemolysin
MNEVSPISVLLREKRIELQLNAGDLKRFPKKGAFILLANRLLEGADELILLELAHRAGKRIRLLKPGNTVPPSLKEYFLSTSIHKERNRGSLSPAMIRQLKEVREPVGMIVDFPEGRWGEYWSTRSLNRLVNAMRELNLPIVPIHIYSGEMRPFPARSAQLLHRIKAGGSRLEVRIGSAVQPGELQVFKTQDQLRRYLQSKIFALGTSLEVRPFFSFQKRKQETPEPLALPVSKDLIEADIQRLTFGNLIAAQGKFDLFVAPAVAIPHVLTEIGRLREWSFRQVGEGTGKSRDLDEYDLYYHQLIIWDREEKRIVGGYRMGKGDEIFAKMGAGGFYVSSLFRIQAGFFPIMKQSVELGRSYIVPDYQKKRLPLFLLWKGILYFLLQNPQYRYLYGPMSISKYYSNVSKSIIVAFIKKYYYDETLAAFLKPRKPFRVRLEKVDIDLLMEGMGKEMRELDNFIEDIEPEHFRIPVLMRQYIKLNARFISFNVDPNFSDVLDGFLILDLQDVPYSMIEALKKEV